MLEKLFPFLFRKRKEKKGHTEKMRKSQRQETMKETLDHLRELRKSMIKNGVA